MTPSGNQDSGAAATPRPWAFEAWLAAGLISFGLFVLPALIYVIGIALLGAYGGGAHLGSFYGDFARDLGTGSARAWSLAVGPYLMVQLGRLVFRDFRPSARPTVTSRREARQTESKESKQPRERREPTIRL